MKSRRLKVELITLITFSVLISSCQKENHEVFHQDPDFHRKDSISIFLINALNSDSIKSTITWMQGLGTRFAFANNHRQVAVRIRDKFIRMGYTDTYLDSFMVSTTWRYQTYSMLEYNVIANLHGASHPDSVIILGAHYDDILTTGDPTLTTPGANDNASGVAAMFEIARVMKQKNYSPRITIQFVAFGAEELGLLGSNDYAAKLALSGRPVKMMINNDMIGYEPTHNSYNWTLNILGYDNSAQLVFDASTLCNRYAAIHFTNDNTNNKLSDSYSFYTRGYQAIYFAGKTPDPNIHTIDDISYNINMNYLTTVISVPFALLIYAN